MHAYIMSIDSMSIYHHLNKGKGFYIPPTVLVDVPVTSKVWTEEIFGPVLCIRVRLTPTSLYSCITPTDATVYMLILNAL
jgi:delta 1-pyrroline-5-carboxylate dehydrogenase